MMRCPGGFATGAQAESSLRQRREQGGMSLTRGPALCAGSRALSSPSPEPTECPPQARGSQPVCEPPACLFLPCLHSPREEAPFGLFPSLTSSFSISCALGLLRWSPPLPLRVHVLSLIALCLPPEAWSARLGSASACCAPTHPPCLSRG